MASNNFQVRVTGDTSKFDASMSKAQRELLSFQTAAKAAFSVVGITSFTAAFSSAAKTIADFERANSELAAVLGTNLKGIEKLTQSAKDLGRTSEFTASEVTQLQIALSRLGFDTGQIEEMQAAVLNFALAMGTDLGSAADFAGATLRAFGLDAKDTTYLLDVMSAATTNSALDFSKLQTSISVVAPIAKSFGLGVEETAAFLGVLANNGFDASSAATALRNILLNLSDANGKLASGIGHSARTFDEIIDAFKELQSRGIDVSEVLAMTDKRSAAAATTIITQADAVRQLKERLDDAEGSLKQMADTMSDNLLGSMRSLSSAWEGFILSMENSKGVMKTVIDDLTRIVNRLTDVMSGLDKITAWEAILGPVAGGAIASVRRRTPDNAGTGFSSGGSGGGARGGEESTASTAGASRPELTKEQLAAIAAAAAVKASRESLKDWASMVSPIAMNLPGTVSTTAGTGELPFKPVISNWAGFFDGVDEAIFQEFPDGLKLGLTFDYQDGLTDLTDELNSVLNDLANSTGEAIGVLIGDLITGGDAWGNFANAALSAFGDMAVSIGKMAIATGVATLGIKAALESLNGYVAIAAGVALVALGTAVKRGLSNVASGNYSSSSSIAGAGTSVASGDFSQKEINVNVTGTLVANGSQLVAVLNNEQNRSKRTT